MGELVTALRHYIARDLVFLVSGGSVVATFLYVFSPVPILSGWPTISYVLAAGIAYVVGYAVQDICSLAGFVTTAPVQKPWSRNTVRVPPVHADALVESRSEYVVPLQTTRQVGPRWRRGQSPHLRTHHHAYADRHVGRTLRFDLRRLPILRCLPIR